MIRSLPLRRSRGLKIRLDSLDALWAKVVKTRDHWTCRRCGKSYPDGGRGLQAMHIIPRRYHATRWKIANGLTGCTGCHRWTHEHPDGWIAWVKKQISEDGYDVLRILAQTGRVDREQDRFVLRETLKDLGVR